MSLETVPGVPVDTVGSDSTRWSSHTRLYNYLLGHNNAAATTVQYWAASEYMQVGSREFIGAYDGTGIRIGELQWWSTSPDSFSLITPTFAAVGEEPAEVQTPRLLVAGLRPAVDRTEFIVQMPQAARGRLAVYDVLGRRIATLLDGTLASGRTTVAWDGHRTTGERVRSGVYFVKLFTSAGDCVARVPLLR